MPMHFDPSHGRWYRACVHRNSWEPDCLMPLCSNGNTCLHRCTPRASEPWPGQCADGGDSLACAASMSEIADVLAFSSGAFNVNICGSDSAMAQKPSEMAPKPRLRRDTPASGCSRLMRKC
eukprot:365788-Chlamydomonas_euryale.AAC.6